jgi:hypothetical protein
MSNVNQALRSITEMFIAGLENFSDDRVEKLDIELSRLVGIVETEARAELSRSLAPLAHAPAQVMRRLAFEDDIAVAGPVLEQSSLLTSDDLVYLARSRGLEHLAAICARTTLSVGVTDALLERGDAAIFRKVAEHPGADLSLSSYGMLIGRAHRDAALAVAVGSRTNIPVNALKALLSHVNEEVRARIQANTAASGSGEGREAVQRIFAELASAVRQPSSDFSAVHQELLGLHRAGALNDAQVQTFANAKLYDKTVVALSLLTDVPPELIERVFRHSIKAPLVPCRAASLAWPTAAAVMRLCLSIHPTAKPDFAAYHATYAGMTHTAALSVLRYWVVVGPVSGEAARSHQAGQAPRRIANRRRAPRHQVKSPGTLLTLDGLPIVTCTIVDVSEGGAQLELAQAMEVPDQIALLLSASRHTRRVCDVMWRGAKTIGVKFVAAGRMPNAKAQAPLAKVAAGA